MGFGIFVLTTQLHNQTDVWIEFDVDKGLCPLRGLPPGKTRSVKLSRIMQCCRERGSPHWPIRVTVNNACITGMHIYARDILYMTRIVIKYKRNTDGNYVLCAEGIKEKARVDFLLRLKVIGVIFGRNTSWNKRPLLEIAQADSTWSRDSREFEDARLAAPLIRHENSLPLRQAAASGGRNRSAATSPPEQERIRRRRNGVGGAAAAGRTTPESVTNSGENSTAGINERDQKRLYRLRALQRKDVSTHVLLFGSAFVLIAVARFSYCYL